MKKLLICSLLLLSAISAYSRGKSVSISVNSEPAGAKVFVDGKNVGTTPCKIILPGKTSQWVYDIDASRVKNPDRPPYSKKITFVLDGYETAVEYWEGMYEYHESGFGVYRQEYYIVKPQSMSVMAVLKKDSAQSAAKEESSQKDFNSNDELIIQLNVDSDPSDARVFWRIISNDKNLNNTEQQYLGKTPLKENKSFRIDGLTNESAENAKLELIVKKNGYYDETKLLDLSGILDIMEINGYFEMQIKE